MSDVKRSITAPAEPLDRSPVLGVNQAMLDQKTRKLLQDRRKARGGVDLSLIGL